MHAYCSPQYLTICDPITSLFPRVKCLDTVNVSSPQCSHAKRIVLLFRLIQGVSKTCDAYLRGRLGPPRSLLASFLACELVI
jgi:hypothetical protein